MTDFVLVLMRWLHISSAAILVGGMLYGRVALTPEGGSQAAEAWRDLLRRAADRFRPVVYAAIPASLVSGIFKILISPGHSARYHMLLGMKLLLVAHIFATALMVTTNKSKRPARAMAGAAISGLIVIAIGAYLQRFP